MWHRPVISNGIATVIICSMLIGGCDDPQTQTLSPGANQQSLNSGSRPFELPGEPAPTLARRVVRKAQSRLAVCNNGEDFAYYIRRGTGSGTNKWVLFLKGGGSCTTTDECAARQSNRTDPPGDPTLTTDGILSADATLNPDFYNWNHVYMYYCSSDLWFGDRGASVETANLHFRGSRIFQAVIEDLLDPAVTEAPTLGNAGAVILAGSSAGGAGVANTIHRLYGMLPRTTPLVGIVDSALAPAVKPYVVPDPALLAANANRVSFWNAQVNPACAADLGNPSLCAGTLLLPYFPVPMFYYYDQADSNRLPTLGIDDLSNADQQAWVLEVFAPAVRAQLALTSGYFSTFVRKHTAVAGSAFYSLTVDGLTYRDVFANWYFNRPGPTKVSASMPAY